MREESGKKEQKDRKEAREERRKNFDYTPVISVNITKQPEMGRVNELEPGQGFWRRRNRGFYVVVGDNCYTEAVKDKFTDEEKVIVVFSVSDKLILTVPADEWVVMANKIEMNVS